MWICLQNHKSLDSFSFTTELQAPEPHREATRGNSQHTGRYLGAQSPWCSPQHTLCAEFPCSWSTLHFSGLTELGRKVLTEQSALCLSPSQYGHWEQSQVSSKRFTWKESPLPEWVNLACWDNCAVPSEEETLDLPGLSHFWCLWMTSVSLLVCHTIHCLGIKHTKVFQSDFDCWSPTLLSAEESMEGRAEWLTPQMPDHSLCCRKGERRGLWEFCKLKFGVVLLVELCLPETAISVFFSTPAKAKLKMNSLYK